MASPLPSMWQHLREKGMEICAQPQRTHSDKQILYAGLSPSTSLFSFGLCLFSATPPSFTPPHVSLSCDPKCWKNKDVASLRALKPTNVSGSGIPPSFTIFFEALLCV
ncbi:hypothetical protein CHARACLAT_006057 [Characodon lateralis]|uniref:Uncharacterized protein n=1 Tax=Characodon lateralis TaxID=208331 RepID=A0ABU7F0Y1_9TELE|nr:hypothetical protein [Characodon lateralis]